jgi:uncharacterized protein
MMGLRISEAADGIRFDVQVAPRASRERLGPVVGDRLKIQLTAAPVDGAANDALRAVLAKALSVPRSAVTIERGETSRKKTVHVGGVTAAALRAATGET